MSTAGEGWDRHTAKPQQIHPSAGCCWGDSPSIGVPGGPYGPQKLRLDGLMAMGCSAAIANDLNASQSHFCSQSSLEKNIFNSTQYLIEGDKVISTSLVFPFAQSLKGQQQWRASAPTINGAYFLSWTVIAGVASRGGDTVISDDSRLPPVSLPLPSCRISRSAGIYNQPGSLGGYWCQYF